MRASTGSTAMATVNLHLPRQAALGGLRSHTIAPRDIAMLSLAVALCCAASMFALLCKSDRTYPVAPMREEPVAVSAPAAAPVAERAGVIESHSTLSVAHTHGELLALERRGERNYVEFSVTRSGAFQPVGPIELGLWGTDARHDAIQASVIVGERRFDLKRLKVDERVLIPIGNSENLELVVNRLGRNQISGYISEPKTETWQLARAVFSR